MQEIVRNVLRVFRYRLTLSRSDLEIFHMLYLWLSEKQVVSVVKEVIRLDVYLLVIFNPYYYPSPPLWKVLANSMSSCW